MRIRLIALAVLALGGLTAFAPAPFMRVDRKKESDTLSMLQGTWSMTEKVRMGPNGQLSKYSTTQKVVIEKDSWRFSTAAEAKALKGVLGGKGGGVGGGFAVATRTSYKIVLDNRRLPMEFRLKRTTPAETDYMVGILYVKDNTVKVLYRLGSTLALRGQEEMPRNFDTVPEGWYSMTLTRDK